MIEPLKPKQSLKVAELQDGDVICFQRVSDKAAEPKRTGELEALVLNLCSIRTTTNKIQGLFL